MYILRLPPSLRRALLVDGTISPHIRCHISTSTHSTPPNNALPPLTSGSPALLTLSSTTLNSYTRTIPPSTTKLKYANNLFASQPPHLLFSAAHFRSFPPSYHPEVAFLGRSNVGKSSLLNALFNRTNDHTAHVSKRPGRTRTMNGFGILPAGLSMGAKPKEGEKQAAYKRFPRGGLVLVDMPGYGGGSREEWGTEALKYLENRRQLRRTFVMVDAEHGLKQSDIQLLTHLRRTGIAHQIILSKVDKLLHPGAKPPSPQKLSNCLLELKDLCRSIEQRLDIEAGDGRRNLNDMLCCSAEKSLDERGRRRKLGVDEVRWAVLTACGLECDESGQRRSSKTEDIHIIEDDE